MRKRILSVLLAASMTAVLLAGCGGGGGAQPEQSQAAGSSAPAQESSAAAPAGEGGEQAAAGDLTLPIAQSPTEFTIFLSDSNMNFNPEWRVWQEAAKRTNISLKSVISQSNSNEQEAFNLMVSSGKLADIIGYVDVADLEKLGRDGGMLPLNDLIAKNAPHIQKLLDTDPGFRQTAYSLDGNIYQIPKNQELVTSEFWWIRKDWLGKLKLEVPTTVDQLHEVLLAFRNNDPNENGEKDEVPLFDREGNKWPGKYLCLWDSSLEFYPRDGKMTFEPMEENFKVAMKNLVQWYQEDLIDKEIFTRGPKSRDILLGANQGGVTHDWPSTGDYNTLLADQIPGLEMMAFAPPADQNGVVKERTERKPGVGWGISAQCSDPDTVMKFFDYMFTEEGDILMNWGIEGETYTVNSNGVREYTETVMTSDQTPLGYLRSLGIQHRIGMSQRADYEYAFMTPAAKQAAELYNSHTEWFLEDMPPYADGMLGLKYTPEDETEYKKIMSNIKPYVDERFQAWVLGTSDFEADYDNFIAELKTRGIEKAIEINQRAYDTYLGK